MEIPSRTTGFPAAVPIHTAAAPFRFAPSATSAPLGRLGGRVAVTAQCEWITQPQRPKGAIGITGALVDPSQESSTKRRWTTIESASKELTAHYGANWPSLRRLPARCNSGCRSDATCHPKNMPDVLSPQNLQAMRATRLRNGCGPCWAFGAPASETRLKPGFRVFIEKITPQFLMQLSHSHRDYVELILDSVATIIVISALEGLVLV